MDRDPLLKVRHFSEVLNDISHKAQTQDLTVADLFECLGERSHLLLILLFSVPFLQPIPLMGLSTPLGGMIILISYQALRNQPPWLPKKFRQLVLPGPILIKTVEIVHKIWSYISKIIKQRLNWLYTHSFFNWANFIVIAVNAFLLALPLPIPFSNTVPTIVIVANILGRIEKDGWIILLSYFSGLVSVSFFVGLGAGAYVGLMKYWDKIVPYVTF